MNKSPVDKKFEVFALADLCVDLLFTGQVRPKYGQDEQLVEDYTLDLGGSAAIFAAQFAKLGGKVGLLAKIGTDAFGEILLSKVRENGIYTEFIFKFPKLKTALGLGLFDGKDRAMLTYSGSMLALKPEDVLDQYLDLCSHWHLASYYLLTPLRDFWPDFLKKLRAKGVSISLDTNFDPEEKWKDVWEILPLTDVFLPNETEAMRISGESNLINAGKTLAKSCPLVVIKCGDEGAIAFRNQEILHFPIPKILTEHLQIADTTGAGDNFDAGFLRNWLLGKNLEDCIDLAMRCAVSSLRSIGGIEGQLKMTI